MILNDPNEIGDTVEFFANGRCRQFLRGTELSGYRRWWVGEGEIVLDRYPMTLVEFIHGLPSLVQRIAGGSQGYVRIRISKLSTDEFNFDLFAPDGTALGTPPQAARRLRQ